MPSPLFLSRRRVPSDSSREDLGCHSGVAFITGKVVQQKDEVEARKQRQRKAQVFQKRLLRTAATNADADDARPSAVARGGGKQRVCMRLPHSNFPSFGFAAAIRAVLAGSEHEQDALDTDTVCCSIASRSDAASPAAPKAAGILSNSSMQQTPPSASTSAPEDARRQRVSRRLRRSVFAEELGSLRAVSVRPPLTGLDNQLARPHFAHDCSRQPHRAGSVSTDEHSAALRLRTATACDGRRGLEEATLPHSRVSDEEDVNRAASLQREKRLASSCRRRHSGRYSFAHRAFLRRVHGHSAQQRKEEACTYTRRRQRESRPFFG